MRALATATMAFAIAATAVLAQTGSEKSTKKKRESAHTTLLTRVSPLSLLQFSSVRKELNLTPEQESRWKKYQQESEGSFEKLADQTQEVRKQLGPEQLAVVRQEQAAGLRAKNAELNKQMLAALDPRQRARLDQIGIQREGLAVFLRPEVQERLNMSPGQVDLVQEIMAEEEEAIKSGQAILKDAEAKATYTPIPGSNRIRIDDQDIPRLKAAREQSEKAVKRARESAEVKILKNFSKKQRQVYLAMKGEPFDLASLKFGRPSQPFLGP